MELNKLPLHGLPPLRKRDLARDRVHPMCSHHIRYGAPTHDRGFDKYTLVHNVHLVSRDSSPFQLQPRSNRLDEILDIPILREVVVDELHPFLDRAREAEDPSKVDIVWSSVPPRDEARASRHGHGASGNMDGVEVLVDWLAVVNLPGLSELSGPLRTRHTLLGLGL